MAVHASFAGPGISAGEFRRALYSSHVSMYLGSDFIRARTLSAGRLYSYAHNIRPNAPIKHDPDP
jgi:hypothetical protein